MNQGSHKKLVLAVLLVTIAFSATVISCAGSMDYAQARYEPEPAKGKSAAKWEQDPGSSKELQLAYSQGSYARKKSLSKSGGQDQKPQVNQIVKKKKKPLVVYQGYLRLRVRRTIEAADAITKITEKAGGYIESLTEKVVVVRIPAGDFEAIMDKLASVGKLLDRQVKALDVTEQFTDMKSRLAVAMRTRARLVKLFEQTEKAEERLRILKEIKRLTERIEYLQSTLDSLKNLVDFFTITIELEPVMESGAALVHRSPFAWVRNLSAHMTSITDGKDDVKIALPAGFVLFDEDDSYRAQAADTSMIRAGYAENEPRGDNSFWMDAVSHEMDGRDEETADIGTAGKVSYKVFRSRDAQPRYYLVGVMTQDDRVYVLEVFYPKPEAYKRHHKAVVKALATFKTM